jgi:parvulin-like peptidyl-prolyl isomerase
MRHTDAMRALPLLLLCAACGSIRESPDAVPPTPPAVTTASAPAPRPALTWKGDVIEWSELQPLLAERAGAVVIEETLLDRQLDRLLAERGLKVDAAATDRERAELLESLNADPERAERLLLELRALQGLGERRWAALMRRNAAARLLVQDQITLTPEAVDAALDATHGARRVCRILTVADLKTCAEARRRIDAGQPFGEVAAMMSTDPSSSRGGLVNPVSRLDPTWPSAFRQAVWALQIGGTSAPVLVGDAYVLVKVESETPANAPADPAAARRAAEREVRRNQERVRMEGLVSGLRQGQRDAVILDEALRDSWSRVRNAAR